MAWSATPHPRLVCSFFARRPQKRQRIAQMHGSRIFFALHIVIIRAYNNDIAGADNERRKRRPEENTMNPIRIAKNWVSYRRTMNELGNLSNQALSDIGLTRYDIRNIAARSFR
jgi:uncharacterized protein YjiS (DUF1127 family)